MNRPVGEVKNWEEFFNEEVMRTVPIKFHASTPPVQVDYTVEVLYQMFRERFMAELKEQVRDGLEDLLDELS